MFLICQGAHDYAKLKIALYYTILSKITLPCLRSQVLVFEVRILLFSRAARRPAWDTGRDCHYFLFIVTIFYSLFLKCNKIPGIN